jgi:sodium/hydrogen antiporter
VGDLAVLAGVVFVFGLVSRRLEGTVLTAPLVFVAAGVVLGPAGVGLVEFGLDDHTVLLLGEIALAIVLFTDAARTNLSTLRQNEGLPLRLLGIGMPLTIALGTVVAALVLTDLSLWEAAIVGTVLAPTDAALGQAVVSNPRVPVRVRQALNVEAGLSYNTIWRIEDGRQGAHPRTIRKLAEALGVRPSELIRKG